MCQRKHHTAGGRYKESLERDGTRISQPAKLSRIPDDAEQIVRRHMGLPVVAGCDTARDRTRICSVASSTVMQCSLALSSSAEARSKRIVLEIGATIWPAAKLFIGFSFILSPKSRQCGWVVHALRGPFVLCSRVVSRCLCLLRSAVWTSSSLVHSM